MAVYGIIGCGNAAKHHADAILQNKESFLKAVFDINSRKARIFADKYGCEVSPSLHGILDDKRIGAVIICTPHDTHTDIIKKVLVSRKFCITEKPLYLNDKGRKAVEKFANSKKAIVVFQVRYHSPILFLLESVKKGKLGKIRFCGVTVRKNRDKKYFSDWHGVKRKAGGMLLNQGMHALDLMLEICGTPVGASGIMENVRKLSEFEDLYVGSVRFLNGAAGKIEIMTCSRDEKPENSIIVVGERGSIKIGGGIFDHIEYAHFDDGQAGAFSTEKDGDGHPKFLSAVNDYIIRGKRHPFLPLIKDGLRANRFADLLYKTAQNL